MIALCLLYVGQSNLFAQKGGAKPASKPAKVAEAKKDKKAPKGGKGVAQSALTPQAQALLNAKYFDASTKLAQQQPEEAAALFREVLQIDPDHHASLYFLAKILVDQGRHDDALPLIQRALKLDQKNLYYFELCADLYQRANQAPKAVEIIEQALKQFTGSIELRIRLADLYVATNQKQKALAIYDTLIVRTGQEEEYGLMKARLYLLLQQYDDAAKMLQLLIVKFPEKDDYQQLLYEVYSRTNKEMEAVALLEDMLKKDAGNTFALVNLMDYYRRKDQGKRANELLDNAIAAKTLNVQTKIRLMSTLLQNLSDDTIRVQVDRLTKSLLQIYPNDGLVTGLRGDYFNLTNEPDSARRYYHKATRISEANDKLWELLLQKDAQLEQTDSLIKHAEEALEIFPNNPYFNYLFGLSVYEKKRYKDAVSAFERFLKLGATDRNLQVQIYSMLGDAYFQLKEYKKSDVNFVRALRINPDDFTTLNNYAYYLSLRKERLDTALVMIRKVIDAKPNESSYLDTYGWVLYQMGQHEDALVWVRKAYDQRVSGEIAEHMGDIMFRLGKKDEALRYWKEAKEKGQTGEEIDKKISTGILP
jgi:tetratricopeptide (TPR) repeat protein